MKRELIAAIIGVACILALFVTAVVITEQQNFKSIREQYAQSMKPAEVNRVSVPAPSDLALKFQKNKVTVWIISLLWGMIIPAIFLFTGLSANLRTWAQGKSSRYIIVLAIYFISFSVINYLLTLPLDFYGGFIRAHSYGLSNQAFGKWVGDSLKSLAISTLAGAAFIWVPYLIIRKSPDRWWLYVGLLSIPVLMFMTFISPVFIDPLFNKYLPVQDKALEAKIHQEINRTVIGDCNVYQVDKSVDTKEMNAYMTGVLNTKRIVLWDTTINKLNNREILCILAHEMGHYLMGHVWKSIVLGGALCIFVLYFVNASALWIISKSGGVFGFKKLSDIASLPLLILLINLFLFALTPVTNAYSRYNEHEADRFELELTHDNYASATAMVKLHEQSLILPEPGTVYKLWNYDHPTFKERVDFSNTYKPWAEGKPVKYQRFIVK